MSDTPDFDSMSPEEMMKWMESLAKRQGAAEGFTTDADLEIDEVDENDERLEGIGEYKPYGMSDEEWAKMQEREEAEKAARLAAAQQQSEPEPEPEPEPVAEAPAASADGEPDFDSMTPEEMMEWMESLAKRQGATEGMTTSASMEIGEVDENDERLEGLGEYKPYGMSDEEWAKMQEREEAEKAARLAAQQQSEPEPETEPVVEEPVASNTGEIDPENMSPEEMMEWMESLAKRQGATEGMTTSASMEIGEIDENDERLQGLGEYKPYGMSDEEWAKMQEREEAEKMARLAEQEEIEYVDEDSEPIEYVNDDSEEYEFVDIDDEDYIDYDEEEYIEYDEEEDEELVRNDMSSFFDGEDSQDAGSFLAGLVEDADDPEPELADPNDFLASLGASDDEEELAERPPMDASDFLSGLGDDGDDPNEFLSGLAEQEEDDVLPNDFLSGLFGGDDAEEAPDLDLEGLSDLEGLDDLGALAGLDMQEEVEEDAADWLAGLEGDAGNDVEEFQELIDSSEGSTEWMESLAKRQGASEDELTTDADLDIPEFEEIEASGPGYEDFSFEDATGMVQDTTQLEALTAEGDIPDIPGMDLDDPEGWLDQLASGVSDNEIPDDIFDDEASIEDADEDDEVDDADEYEERFEAVKSQMDSGRLGDSPEDVDQWFRSAFEKASQRDDVPDYVDMDDEEDVDEDEVELPLEAEIPDWLQDSMNVMPSDSDDKEDLSEVAKTATAEMMIADLGLDDDGDIEAEIPDWLQGEVVDDGEPVEEAIEAEIPDWLQEGMSEDTGLIEADIFAEGDTADEPINMLDITDTQDTWVEAFSNEDDEALDAWYQEAVAEFEGGSQSADVIADDAAPETDTELQSANLPMETKLSEGTPMAVPDWLAGDDMSQSVEMPATEVNDMDWMTEPDMGDEDIDMPDWLKDTVDDTVTEGDDLPDWLAGETDIVAEEIPDWLRETMDEEEEAVEDAEFDDIFVDDTPETEPELPVVAETRQPAVPAPVEQSPAPVPVAAEKIDVVAHLRSANSRVEEGDIEGALLDYEQVIRANKALPQVEKELNKILSDKTLKRNPAVNRVLGDVLMRQGKLQEALDIYRKALNML